MQCLRVQACVVNVSVDEGSECVCEHVKLGSQYAAKLRDVANRVMPCRVCRVA